MHELHCADTEKEKDTIPGEPEQLRVKDDQE